MATFTVLSVGQSLDVDPEPRHAAVSDVVDFLKGHETGPGLPPDWAVVVDGRTSPIFRIDLRDIAPEDVDFCLAWHVDLSLTGQGAISEPEG